MSGVFRQNSDKPSVYSDATTDDYTHTHTHTQYVSYHYKVHAHNVLVQLNLLTMELQWTTVAGRFCFIQVLEGK